MASNVPISVDDYKKYSSSSGLDGLIEKLNQVDKKYLDNKYYYDYEAPQSLGLEKLEYQGLTDEEIAKQSQEKLDSIFEQQKNALQSGIDLEKKELEKEKQKTQTAKESLSKQIDNLYKERLESAEKNAIKRGLARSSIIMNQIEDFDREKVEDKKQLEKESANAYLEIDNKISALDGKIQQALKDYDIEYAIELNDEILKLKKEREDKAQEVLKYNNTLAEKEAEYLFDLEQQKFENTQKQVDNLKEVPINTYINSQKIKLAKDYFLSIDPKQAYDEFLSNQQLKEHFGNSYDAFLKMLRQKMLDAK